MGEAVQIYILRRLLVAIPTLIGLSLLIFVMMRMVPGDIATQTAQKDVSLSPQELASLRRQYGLDRPLYLQYVGWLGGVAHGDLGISMWSRKPVWGDIRQRAPVSIELGVMGWIVGLAVGVSAGVISGLWPGTGRDYSARLFAIAGLSIPDFVLGTLIILVLALQFGWSPGVRFVALTVDPAANLRQMFLPALVIGFTASASVARLTRSSMLDVLHQDYIRTALAKGLRTRTVILRHCMKNAFPPVLTIVGLQLAYLVSGLVIVETIFNLPGLGTIFLSSVQRRDYIFIQSFTLLVGTTLVIANLVVDVLYVWLDPQIRYT